MAQVSHNKTTPSLMPIGWQPVEPVLRESHPEAPWSWLLEPGSLTRRLQQICPGAFNLRLLSETSVNLGTADAAILGSDPESAARAREVHLACGGVPCIYAFSLLPQSTLRGGGNYLDRLGTRPLGDALFSDPTLERGEFEVIKLRPDMDFHARALHNMAASDIPIWGRRSVFRTRGSSLLVCEFFLPGLSECANHYSNPE